MPLGPVKRFTLSRRALLGTMQGMAKHLPTRTALAAAAHQFKGLQDWVEVFRSGTHTDSTGKRCTFSDADLDQMVANVALGKPPAVLGHPKHDDPAYGQATLKREGTSLFAKFDQVHPGFEAGVKSGAYYNRSVSVLKDADHGWRVRHVGWLGAAPPAIDGLTPVSFGADSGAEIHEFMDADDLPTAWALGDVGRLLRSMRDWLIGKDGIEVANQVLPDYAITSITESATQIRRAALASNDEAAAAALFQSNQGHDMSFTAEDLQRAADEAAAKAKTEIEARFAAQTTQLATLQSERQAERIGVQIAGWKAAGQLLPAEEAGLAEFMAALEDGTTEFQFTAAGATEPAKQSPAAWFGQFVAARKPLLNLGQQRAADDTSGGTAQASNQEVADRARNYQAAQSAKGHRISISDAVDAVNAGKDRAA